MSATRSATATPTTAPGMTFPLTPRLSSSAVRPAAAWFVPGADAGAWVDEIARWGVPMAGLRLYVLPTSLADRGPSGVLVVPPAGLAAGRLHIPSAGPPGEGRGGSAFTSEI